MASSENYFSDGKRGNKAPEKSNFAQTCNLLSQYLKEKGRLRDLNLGISGKVETPGKPEVTHVPETATRDLLTSIDKSSQMLTEPANMADPSPRNTGKSTPGSGEEAKNAASPSKGVASDVKIAQMTIFYAGKVFVFDEFPADKARAVMLLASKGSPYNASGAYSIPAADKTNPSAAMISAPVDPPKSVSSPPKPESPVKSEANGSDLPIARRSSLHRFLEKRKDRATARAPYQVVHHVPASTSKDGEPSSKNGESSSKKGESSSKSEEQLELKL